jgi:anti-sigma regulatory factor (Ser/Thr protein kinase)
MSQMHETSRAQFNHEVTFYAGPDDHARSVLPFIREGIAAREPVMVALVPERIAELEEALGNASSQVEFVDMTEIGANPACIIPEWRRFLRNNAANGAVRGVGEPAWPGRRDVELAEAELHESLINLAFDDGPAWRLLCPYDYTALPSEILEEALRIHPVVHDGFGSTMPLTGNGCEDPFSKDLPSAPARAMRIDFGPHDLTVIRGLVRRVVDSSTLSSEAGEDLVLAAHEVAANSVTHGGGHGLMQIWDEADALVIDVRDDGFIADPLVGRGYPDVLPEHGRGIWLANRLCDLVQVRSGVEGTQVRLHAWL